MLAKNDGQYLLGAVETLTFHLVIKYIIFLIFNGLKIKTRLFQETIY